ncbi:MAG: rhodanese-like domain-containing protein [Pseudomonadota bacterium]
MFRFVIYAALLALTAFTPHSLRAAPLVEVTALSTGTAPGIIVDIRAPEDYAAGHVPGAVNAPYPLWRGPAENPGRALDDEALTSLLRSLGISEDARVTIAYQGRNATDFGAAARVYWTLKSAGLTDLAILNGGVEAWAEAGLPLSTDAPAIAPSTITVSLSPQWMMTRDEVADVVAGRSNARMIDARPLDFFEGRKKHSAATEAGTLKGALNVIHSSWFGENEQRMNASPEAIRSILASAGYEGELNPDETLVSFCNTGHWAATNWFALSEIAGIENVKLYPESLVGWTNAGGDVVAQ